MKNSTQDVIRQPLTIFLHIPKTAGTTLNQVINNQYKNYEMFSNAHVVTSKLGEEWKKKSALQREEIAKAEFINLPTVTKENIKLIKGHMTFGWHYILKNPCTYITILRNPIERINSLYKYILRIPDHYLSEIITANKMNLKDYVKSGISLTVDNGQTRIISGVGADIEFGKCSTKMLEIAKQNIQRHFSFVGTTERFDESLIVLSRILQWRKIPFYTRQNVAKNNSLTKAMSRDTLNVMESYNQFDIELYKYVQESFEEMLSQQASFVTELERFKLLNRFYNTNFSVYCRRAVNKMNLLRS